MIVQCDQCSARFKLDDSKVSDTGTKVRCTKCKHIFVVHKESPSDDLDFNALLGGLAPSVAEAAPSSPPPQAAASAGPKMEAASAPGAEPGFDFGEVDFSSSSAPAPTEEPAGSGDFDFGEVDLSSDSAPAPAEGLESSGSPFGEFDFQDDDSAGDAPEEEVTGWDIGFGEVSLPESPAAVAGEESSSEAAPPENDGLSLDTFDFGGGDDPFPPPLPPADAEPAPAVADNPAPGPSLEFDFTQFNLDGSSTEDAGNRDTERVPHDEAAPALFAPPVEDETPGTDFQPSATDSFGGDQGGFEFSFDDAEPPAPASEPGDAAFEFSFDHPDQPEKQPGASEKGFDFPFAEPPTTAPAAAAAAPVPAGTPAASFGFDDFQFEESAVPDDQKKTLASDNPDLSIYADEPPPLSIYSRRLGGGAISAKLVVTGLALLAVLGGGSFYVLQQGLPLLDKVGLGDLALKLGMADKGAIGIQGTSAKFVMNQEAGELFVIRGEASSSFARPRLGVQVKASIFGKKGEVLQHRNVYCGSSLKDEQLASMSLADLEKLIATASRQPASNPSVQPGGNIAFVAIFKNVPKDAADYGVEVTASAPQPL